MKAEIINAFNIGDLSLTLTTCLYARKRSGIWRVHLNYHKVRVRYLEVNENNSLQLIKNGLTYQSSRDNDWVSAFCGALGLIGVVQTIIDLIKKVMLVLANVKSLVTIVLKWLQDEVVRMQDSQEPLVMTHFENSLFVINLMNNGLNVERRLPRWRMNYMQPN